MSFLFCSVYDDIKSFSKLKKYSEIHLVIPNGVKEIANSCFEYFPVFPLAKDEINFGNIRVISLPSTIQTLGDRCFANCRYLKSISGLQYVKQSGKGSFMNVNRIKYEIEQEMIRQFQRKDIETMITPKQLMKLEYWVQRKVENVVFDWNNETSQKYSFCWMLNSSTHFNKIFH